MNNITRLYKCLKILSKKEPNVLFVTSNWLHFLQADLVKDLEIIGRLKSLGFHYSSKYETYYLDTEVLFDNRAK